MSNFPDLASEASEAEDEMEDEMEDEDDSSEMETYEVSITVPVTIRFKIEARRGDEADAREVANEQIHDWRLKEYVHDYDGRSAATMLGLAGRRDEPIHHVDWDYPENFRVLDSRDIDIQPSED